MMMTQSRMSLSMKSAKAALRQSTKDTMRCGLSYNVLRLDLTVCATQDTKRTVAIKAVRRDILTAKLFDNLQSEIDILKSLSHRHITKLIDIVVSTDYRNLYCRSLTCYSSVRNVIYTLSWSTVLEGTSQTISRNVDASRICNMRHQRVLRCSTIRTRAQVV